MFENRKILRFPSLARAQLHGLQTGEALLKDLSITGCRLEFSAAVALSPGEACRILVIPEALAQVDAFELEAAPRWSRADYDSFEIGFEITKSPKGKTFQRYVDYLAWRLSAVDKS